MNDGAQSLTALRHFSCYMRYIESLDSFSSLPRICSNLALTFLLLLVIALRPPVPLDKENILLLQDFFETEFDSRKCSKFRINA
jgi:hypothetical protein